MTSEASRNNRTEAIVLTAICARKHAHFGVRAERAAAGAWSMTWAFATDSGAAKRERFGSGDTLSGSLLYGGSYPGCPHCECQQIVQCHCKQLTCFDGADFFECPVCRKRGRVEGHITSIVSTNDR